MQDFLLIIPVIAFMIFGFFIMGKVDKFFAENYKGFEYDEDSLTQKIVYKRTKIKTIHCGRTKNTV